MLLKEFWHMTFLLKPDILELTWIRVAYCLHYFGIMA